MAHAACLALAAALTATAPLACTPSAPAMNPEVPSDFVGSPAPGFSIDAANLSHASISLAGLKGKVVVVDFWGTYCDPCRREFPKLQELYARWRERGLEIVAVSEDEAEARDRIVPFADGFGATFPVAWDAKHAIKGLYLPGDMPSSYVVDRRGVVRFQHIGYRDSEGDELEREIGKLVAEAP